MLHTTYRPFTSHLALKELDSGIKVINSVHSPGVMTPLIHHAGVMTPLIHQAGVMTPLIHHAGFI